MAVTECIRPNPVVPLQLQQQHFGPSSASKGDPYVTLIFINSSHRNGERSHLDRWIGNAYSPEAS